MKMNDIKRQNREDSIELNLQDLNNAIQDLKDVVERELKFQPLNWKIDELKGQIAKLQVVKAAMKGGLHG